MLFQQGLSFQCACKLLLGWSFFSGLDDEEGNCAQDGNTADYHYPENFVRCGERPVFQLKEGHKGEDDPGQNE